MKRVQTNVSLNDHLKDRNGQNANTQNTTRPSTHKREKWKKTDEITRASNDIQPCLLVRFELLLANYLNNRLEKRFIREQK